MKFKHVAILAAWSVFVTLVTYDLLFPVVSHCSLSDQACIRTNNRQYWIVVGSAFVIYWTVFVLLIRKWNRDVS